jgi:hypothetical protein
MGCDHADALATFVSIVGSTFDDPLLCSPVVPLHMVEIRGTDDPTVHYEGGVFPPPYTVTGAFPGAVETIERWATHNGCSLVPDTSIPPIDLDLEIPGDETTIARYATDCELGGSAELWTIVGGRHKVPDPPDVPRRLIEFFYSHPKTEVSTCGNGLREPGEICDGTDLGGESCATQGCTGGGLLSCASNCLGFDTTGCIGCPLCNNDGICDLGEDCYDCPADCVFGISCGADCGNGLCEAGDGEDCLSCPSDCNGTQTGKPNKRFCCGGGEGENPVPCTDSRCEYGSFACTSDSQPTGSFCCGLFGCERGEACGSCAVDCATGFELCDGGVDEDCDGFIDCDDTECHGDPDCDVCTVGQRGDPCLTGTDCCSGACKKNGTCR